MRDGETRGGDGLLAMMIVHVMVMGRTVMMQTRYCAARGRTQLTEISIANNRGGAVGKRVGNGTLAITLLAIIFRCQFSQSSLLSIVDLE